jgi:hypothetical protein
MTDRPITPPPELVQQWLTEFFGDGALIAPGELSLEIANRAAQWGYQQHEKALLDAMHAVVPQPYQPENE